MSESSIETLVLLIGLGAAVGIAYILLMRRVGNRGATRAARRNGQARGPARLSLRAVVNQLVAVGDEETVFLDRASRRFVKIADGLLGDLESDEPVENLIDETTTLTVEQLEALRVGLQSRALIQLPTKAETKEFLLREQFCDQMPDGEPKEQMLKVLRGQTGFRSFDGAVERLGIAQRWYRFRDTAFAGIAADWLHKHEIDFKRDMDVPEPLRQAG